jgi:CBS domain-containing protein
MTTGSSAVTVGPGTSISEAATIMDRREVSRLPVVDAAGRLAGLISRADLLRVRDRPDRQLLADISERVLTGDISCGPPPVEAAVCAGVVTLTGVVASQDMAVSLPRAVWEIDGVAYIRDRLTYPLAA